jgi:hypothetical protein
MEVLFATANSDFYREETAMTKLPSKLDDPSYIANQGKVAFNRSRLIGLARSPQQQLKFRYFDTQYRLPMIIIDERYCYLTIRLSPNESEQSIRLEFHGGKEDFSESCLVHFEQMWSLSSEDPSDSKP